MGLAIFPIWPVRGGCCTCGAPACVSPGKHPRVRGWTETATSSVEQIERWWSAWPDSGIGLATGRKSHLWVLDVDPRHDGGDSLAALQLEHEDLPDTLVARTGGGGQHYYFQYNPCDEIGNSANRLGDGLDVRGDGGFVVMPPSAHASGTGYSWQHWREPSPAPGWLVNLTRKPKRKQREHVDATAASESSTYGMAALDLECKQLAGATEGRNHMLNAAAFALGQLVAGGELTHADVNKRLWDAAVQSAHNGPKPGGQWLARGGADSLRKTMDNGLAAGMQNPRKAPPAAPTREWAENEARELLSKRQARKPKGLILEARNDLTIGRAMLARIQGDGPPPVYDEGALMHYDEDKGVWVAIDKRAQGKVLHSFEDTPVITGVDKSGEPELGVFKLNNSKVKGSIERALDEASSPDFFAGAVPGLSFKNQFVRVDGDTIKAERHSHNHRARAYVPLAYRADARAPRFEKYLDECFAGLPDARERKRAVLQYAGLSLVGLGTRYHKALVLFGRGANGKSVFLDVVRALFPKGSTVSIAPQDFSNEYYVASLAGKLANLVNEMPDTTITSSERFKSLISGDVTQARPIRQAPVFFKPIAGHIFSCNELPGSRDASEGFWRRILVVEWPRIFAPHERDPDLADYIIKREAEGVLTLLINSAATALQQGRLDEPMSSAALFRTWRYHSDQVVQFLAERCRPAAEHGTPVSDLYAAYRDWAQDEGHQRLGRRKFGDRLTSNSFSPQKGAKGVRVRAVDLNSAYQDRYPWGARLGLEGVDDE